MYFFIRCKLAKLANNMVVLIPDLDVPQRFDEVDSTPTREMPAVVDHSERSGLELMICCDANSHNEAWGNINTNNRGLDIGIGKSRHCSPLPFDINSIDNYFANTPVDVSGARDYACELVAAPHCGPGRRFSFTSVNEADVQAAVLRMTSNAFGLRSIPLVQGIGHGLSDRITPAMIVEKLEHRNATLGVFLDLSKAYKNLLDRLERNGIRGVPNL
ncbi:hypothetical protein J6590_071950 [Homalodisca vitripennis]|nr:hypothetical protein J6590_071950 [Homalodisca vitripennis]